MVAMGPEVEKRGHPDRKAEVENAYRPGEMRPVAAVEVEAELHGRAISKGDARLTCTPRNGLLYLQGSGRR